MSILSPRKILIGSGFMALAVMSGCSNAGKSDDGSAQTQRNEGPTQGADQVKPSRIIITPRAEWSDLSGYIVGSAESSRLTAIADQSGKLGFTNLSAGNFEILLFAKQKASDGQLSKVGLRISGIKLGDAQDVQIREIQLKPLIQLDGRVNFEGVASTGISALIEGTQFKTEVAADGSYRFSDVPEGIHALAFKASGFSDGFISAKDYRGSDRLPTINLISDTIKLETGAQYLGTTLLRGSNTRIALQLKAPAGTNSFRYAIPGEDILTRPWQVLQSSLEIDLPTGDRPEVRVQFAQDQSQLSSVYSVLLPVE